MPRYYFDLVDDKTVFDKKGVSLANESEARSYAESFARELMQEKGKLLGESWLAWSVEVSNGQFKRLFRIPFSEIALPDYPSSK